MFFFLFYRVAYVFFALPRSLRRLGKSITIDELDGIRFECQTNKNISEKQCFFRKRERFIRRRRRITRTSTAWKTRTPATTNTSRSTGKATWSTASTVWSSRTVACEKWRTRPTSTTVSTLTSITSITPIIRNTTGTTNCRNENSHVRMTATNRYYRFVKLFFFTPLTVLL